MKLAPRTQVVLGLVAAQAAIFLISLPGFGVETRKSTDYAAWAGPIFLVLTLLVFVLGVGAFLAMRGKGRRLFQLVVAQAAVVLVLNPLDFSGVGGPRPPLGPLVLGAVSIVVAILELAAVLPLRSDMTAPNQPAQ